MRRSFLLSRRIHHHAHHGHPPRHHSHHRRKSHHKRRPSTRRHPRYHRSQKQKRYTRKLRGGNEMIGTWDGRPYTNTDLVTNAKGVTRWIKNIPSPLNDPETAQRLDDIDI